jgi:radical SAM superfamily enzyme YgiQ (UPF0313 family)
MPFKIALLFIPGWTMVTGSPHLALPLLRAYLEANGIEVLLRDLNHEISKELSVHISSRSALEACVPPVLENMNTPYFAAEDKLEAIAARYAGEWNAQLGFWYKGSPERSSRKALSVVTNESPFDNLYNSKVIPELLKEEPDLVGLSIASVYQIIPALQLCRLLRLSSYSGFILLGGNTISRLQQEMAFPEIFKFVDGLMVFEGEEPLLQLCQTLELRQPLDRVPQLIWRDATGKIRQNSNQIDALDLNTVPPPDYRGLSVGQYWGKNYLNIVAARGCYYGKCNFCAIPYGWGHNGFAGMRSPEATYRDMLTLMKRHGINRFKFVDEALSPGFMRVLAERIINDDVDLEWEGYVRFEPHWYEEDFVNLIARAGFRKGYFGLEVIPSKRRPSLNKKDRPKPEELLTRCSSSGINVHLFCMFGFPGTGEREAAETVEFLLAHQDEIDTADIFPWTYAKHTNVPGVIATKKKQDDWSLEFTHSSKYKNILSSDKVIEMSSQYEELLWKEVPRFLHPTYRLVSPWMH